MSANVELVGDLIKILLPCDSVHQLLSIRVKVKDIIMRLVDSSKDKTFRENLPTPLFGALSSLDCCLALYLTTYENQCPAHHPDMVTLATEGFRLLRNACAGCAHNQEAVHSDPDLLDHTAVICDRLCLHLRKAESTDRDLELVCLRCLVQFLGNTVVDFPPGQRKVWNEFKTRFRTCLELCDPALARYTSMVVYNCMGENTDCVEYLIGTEEGVQVITTLLQLLKTQDLDWGVYILETLVRQASFVSSVYSKLNTATRDLLLNFLSAQLESGPQSGDHSTSHVTPVHEDNVLYLCDVFKSDAHVILRLTQRRDEDHLVPELVMCQLSILCSATAQPTQFPQLLEDEDLLRTCVNMLHSTKMLGEQNKNMFTNVEKIAEQGAIKHTINPVFGLKRDLICVLSNMAYRNRDNQDLIRELGGIQLILDHTNIDGRNPFITQWAVFAIRNLCDENPDNQAVIAGLKLEGLSDSVEQLREFGVEVEVQGDQLVVKRVSEPTLEQPGPFSGRKD